MAQGMRWVQAKKMKQLFYDSRYEVSWGKEIKTVRVYVSMYEVSTGKKWKSIELMAQGTR